MLTDQPQAEGTTRPRLWLVIDYLPETAEVQENGDPLSEVTLRQRELHNDCNDTKPCLLTGTVRVSCAVLADTSCFPAL